MDNTNYCLDTVNFADLLISKCSDLNKQWTVEHSDTWADPNDPHQIRCKNEEGKEMCVTAADQGSPLTLQDCGTGQGVQDWVYNDGSIYDASGDSLVDARALLAENYLGGSQVFEYDPEDAARLEREQAAFSTFPP